MADHNLFCQHPDCGRSAEAFRIVLSCKVLVCTQHIPVLLAKSMTICNIAGYHFISSSEDVPIFEGRRTVAERALGHLSVLEGKCDSELREVIQIVEDREKTTIEVLKRSFEEIRLGIAQKHNAAKQELAALRGQFDQYLTSKESDLRENAKVLCQDMASVPKLLRFVLADVSLPLASLLMSRWKAASDVADSVVLCFDAQKREVAKKSLALTAEAEVAAGRIEFGLDDLSQAEALGFAGPAAEIRRKGIAAMCEDAVQLERLFALSTSESSLTNLVSRLLQLGIAAKAEHRYKESLKSLQIAWEFAQKLSSTVLFSIGLPLGELLGLHFSKFQEAENVLRLSSSASQPRSALILCSVIAEVQFCSGKYRESANTCAWIFEAFPADQHPTELYWKAVYYLVLGLYADKRDAEAHAILQEWSRKELARESVESTVIRLCAFARLAHANNDFTEAVDKHAEAHALANQHSLISIPVLNNLRLLGLAYRKLNRADDSLQSFLHAKALFAEHYPTSVCAANTLRNLAAHYRHTRRGDEAEACYLQAKYILDAVAPVSVPAGEVLYEWGLLCEAMNKPQAALSMVTSAFRIYSELNVPAKVALAKATLIRLKQSH